MVCFEEAMLKLQVIIWYVNTLHILVARPLSVEAEMPIHLCYCYRQDHCIYTCTYILWMFLATCRGQVCSHPLKTAHLTMYDMQGHVFYTYIKPTCSAQLYDCGGAQGVL